MQESARLLPLPRDAHAKGCDVEQILRTFGLYDIVAFLVPGGVLAWAVVIALNAFLHAPRPMRVRLSAAFLVGAYITGALLQAAVSPSRPWIKDGSLTAQRIDELYKARADGTDDRRQFREDLSLAAHTVFGDQSPNDVFYLAESYDRVRELSAFPDIMQARYAFFRGLTFSLILALVAFAFAAAMHRPSRRFPDLTVDAKYSLVGPSGEERTIALVLRRDFRPREAARKYLLQCCLLAAASALGIWMSWTRTTDFRGFYADAIYRAFYVDHLNELRAPERPVRNGG
jgi:hypothetical protein